MIYEASTGIVHQPSTKLINGLLLGLPSLIAVLLIAAALSGHTYSAAGQHPTITPKRAAASPAVTRLSNPVPVPANSTSGSSITSSSSSSSSPTGSAVPATQQSTTAPTGGGLGGGSTAFSTSTSGSSLLPVTITAPPLDVQAAGKQLLSISPTSLTIN